jgi:hypothetical protein
MTKRDKEELIKRARRSALLLRRVMMDIHAESSGDDHPHASFDKTLKIINVCEPKLVCVLCASHA